MIKSIETRAGDRLFIREVMTSDHLPFGKPDEWVAVAWLVRGLSVSKLSEPKDWLKVRGDWTLIGVLHLYMDWPSLKELIDTEFTSASEDTIMEWLESPNY
jgi:hypothetical protein